MTLSTPVKIVALAGLALALGLGGVAVLLAKHRAAPAPTLVPPVVHHDAVAAAVKAAAKPKPHPKPKVKILPGTPPLLAAALTRTPIVVVAVVDSRVPGDHAVFVEARAAARGTHAGFVALNVANDAVAEGLSTWSSSIVDPQVLVLKRPGTIAFGVRGATDRAVIEQAVVNAR